MLAEPRDGVAHGSQDLPHVAVGQRRRDERDSLLIGWVGELMRDGHGIGREKAMVVLAPEQFELGGKRSGGSKGRVPGHGRNSLR